MTRSSSSASSQASMHSPEAILRFWRAVELFTPQPLPKPKDSRRSEPIAEWRSPELLPWQTGHPLTTRRPGPRTVWRHFVYLGVFDLDLAARELESRFGTELPDWSPSRWIHIEAGESEGNWIPQEGLIVLDLMKSLPDTESVVCLSPFRHVVFGLRDALRAEFPRVHVGTVHTYQG